MNPIVFPLKDGDHGQTVAGLQEALQALMDLGALLANNPGARIEFTTMLKPEHEAQRYGAITLKLVSEFQNEQQISPSSGFVDQPTAEALNKALEKLGLLNSDPTGLFGVTGTVRQENGQAVPQTIVRASIETNGQFVSAGSAVTDAAGQYAIRYQPPPGATSVHLQVGVFDPLGKLLQLSDIPDAGALEVVDFALPVAGEPGKQRVLEGRVILENGQPAENLQLRLYRRDFGGRSTLLAETSTEAGGAYSITYNLNENTQGVSLELRAVQDTREVSLSKPLNDLDGASSASLNLAAPLNLQPLEAEYKRLSADLLPHIGQMSKLADTQEKDDRQDLTVLNRLTGWDARLIGLGARSQQLSCDPKVNLPDEGIYGLLRAGLPSDKFLLAQVEPDVAEQALKTVRDAGIVELDDTQIAEFKQAFTTFSNNMRLAIPAPGSNSTYDGLLKASGLPQDVQDKFVPVFFNHQGKPAELWEAASEAGLTGEQIGKLQLQGKLAFLAGNSAEMTARLMQKQISTPADLVGHDLHRAEAWRDEVFDQAGIPAERRANLSDEDKQALETIIPTAYRGSTTEDRLGAYSEDMARKVRLSYPTDVTARLIEADEIYKLPSAHEDTVALLKKAIETGFRFGETPAAAFLQQHPEVAQEASIPAQQQLQALQTKYNISPSDKAMPVLGSLNMHSAFDVSAYSDEQFEDLFNARYLEIHKVAPPLGMAKMITTKVKQVSSVTYNLFTIAKKLSSEPPVAGLSAPPEVRENVRNKLIKHFPTMESLFGSLDFCDCEHCRSVLSPAAYLVDLLQFIDPEPGVWDNFLATWQKTHNGQAYPHQDANGNPMRPYDVLIERRPDLPHIPLTCENTLTPLPYIDIVLEILEYFVAHGKLEKEAARDTGDATPEELLAEPQNVIREAYDQLRQAPYPLNLPFDPWLEMVRQFFSQFETPLEQVLETLRPSDELFASSQPFDRAMIFLESLGLSPAEIDVFTNPNPLSGNHWHELYGFPADIPFQDPTNVGNATLNVDNDRAIELKIGPRFAYFDTSTNVTSADNLPIRSIGAPNSGGNGFTLITMEGTWATVPQAGNFLTCVELNRLSSAKALSRRLAVSYQQLVDIIQTGFVNPGLVELTLLYKLGVSVQDARLYQQQKTFYEQNKDLTGKARDDLSPADQKRFDDLAKTLLNTTKTGWDILNEVDAFAQRLRELAAQYGKPLNDLETSILNIPFDAILVLADPDAGCDFDLTTLQYASGRAADAIVFLHINLFTRLWRKLGWSIEETDRALCTFVPASAPFDEQPVNLAKAPLITALIYLSHLKSLNDKLKIGKDGRLKLITLWSDIATTGKKPLYARLFLTRSVLKTSPVFDDPLGQYLSDPSVKVKDHMLALQGALGLTSADINLILNEAGKSLDSAELSLSHVSLLYRYSLLAKALKLSVTDLIALKQLSGLDPLQPLDPDPLTSIAEDHPFSQTLRFIEIAAEIKESGSKIESLEYLLRHRFDETGKYRPHPDLDLALLKTLSGGIRAIRAEQAIPAEVGALSEDTLRQKLGLVLPADVAQRFLAMMNGTIEFTATRTAVLPSDQLTPDGFAGEQTIREVRYNETRQEQKLIFRGVLFDPEKADLMARLPLPLPHQPHVASPVLADLLDDVQKQAYSFFEKYLLKQTSIQPATGFLDPADFDLLFAPLSSSMTDVEQRARRMQQLTRLVQAFFPYLQQQLIRQFIVQVLAAQTGADPVLVESLVTDERMLKAIDGQSLLESFRATGLDGVSAQFFDSNDLSGGPQATTPTVRTPDTSLKDSHDALNTPLNPADSARFQGYLEVATAGAYRFYIGLEKQNAAAALRFYHLPDPLFLSGVAGIDNDTLGDQADEYLELKAGVPYYFSLEVENLNGGRARLLVQGESLSKGELSQLVLYPFRTIDGAERALVLLNKAIQIAQNLQLSERELRYLLTHAADFAGLDLSGLPTQASDDTLLAAQALFTQFLRLAAYARLKRDVAAGTDDLIAIFEINGTGNIAMVYQLFATLTRREVSVVKTTAEQLFGTPAFASEQPLQRLWETLQIVELLGSPVASLTGWTNIVNAAIGPEQRFEIARDLKEAIKARFEPELWQRLAQPIFDRLRQRQRDALVTYVMYQQGFDRIEQLYEYFLIDPGMEPVVQTSRIRLAIASVQLFIQRCLLNLELKVHPSLINSKLWEWMKRYRVWEANRKIFLFPENWLEPEFRDDKTHLFTELEGTLLQDDVSSDLVEDAFFNYLKKLDQLARLDIRTMHIEDNPDPMRRVLHVIGRTHSQPHHHFYRRYVHQMWTPWEPVTAEIEGDHLAPIVWRDRLYVFWVTFLEKADPDAHLPSNDPNGTKHVVDLNMLEVADKLSVLANTKMVEIHLHWSEYANGEWTTRESGGFSDVLIQRVARGFQPDSVFIHVSKEDDENGEERGIYVVLDGVIQQAFYLAGRNSVPTTLPNTNTLDNPFLAIVRRSVNNQQPTRYGGAMNLTVTFNERITTEDGTTQTVSATRNLINKGTDYYVIPTNNEISLAAPEEDTLDTAQPEAVARAIEAGLPEVASLVKPIFYQDDQNTFYIEPDVSDQTIEEWQEWIPRPPVADPTWRMAEKWKDIPVVAGNPGKSPVADGIDPSSLFTLKTDKDWLVNPLTALHFGDEIIGSTGRVTGTNVLSPDNLVTGQHQGGLLTGGINVIGTTGLTIKPADAVTTSDHVAIHPNTLSSNGNSL